MTREYEAKTLKTYLSSLHTFIEWLGSADDRAVATRADTGFATDECVALGITLKNIMKSLQVNINKRQVERGAVIAPQVTLIEAWQEQALQESEVVKAATRLGETAGIKPLSKKERCQVRDTRYTALMLDQIRRAGNLNQITQAQALAVVDQWKRVVRQIRDIRFGFRPLSTQSLPNMLPLTIHAPLFSLFMYYTINVRYQFPTHSTTPNLIVYNSLDSVDAQGKLKSSSITKLYRKPWDAFAREIGMSSGAI